MVNEALAGRVLVGSWPPQPREVSEMARDKNPAEFPAFFVLLGTSQAPGKLQDMNWKCAKRKSL